MIFSFFQRSSKILVSLMKCVIYLHLSFSRTSKLYDCCPKPYVDITYTIHVRRKPLFYTLYLIVPAIIITAMVLVGFYLPPESGERMQLGITVLLAMIVFLQLVYQNPASFHLQQCPPFRQVLHRHNVPDFPFTSRDLCSA